MLIRNIAIALASFALMGLSQANAAANGSHASLKCDTCHAGQTMPSAPAQKTCLQCHRSYEALAAKTKGDKFNPHDSHMGRIDCTQCHAMHKKSHYICHDCHAIKDRKFKGE